MAHQRHLQHKKALHNLKSDVLRQTKIADPFNSDNIYPDTTETRVLQMPRKDLVLNKTLDSRKNQSLMDSKEVKTSKQNEHKKQMSFKELLNSIKDKPENSQNSSANKQREAANETGSKTTKNKSGL
jgi:hypothetical protein